MEVLEVPPAWSLSLDLDAKDLNLVESEWTVIYPFLLLLTVGKTLQIASVPKLQDMEVHIHHPSNHRMWGIQIHYRRCTYFRLGKQFFSGAQPACLFQDVEEWA